MRRVAENNVNYQERARQFAVGDLVVPFGLFESQAGRVTAVHRGIGMVDVEFPTGARRYPVEDVVLVNPKLAPTAPPVTDSTPGSSHQASARRVTALYWAEKDRKYRSSREEAASKLLSCPKCGPESALKKAIYRREQGASDHLLGCPNCMFLIHREDVVNHWDAERVAAGMVAGLLEGGNRPEVHAILETLGIRSVTPRTSPRNLRVEAVPERFRMMIQAFLREGIRNVTISDAKDNSRILWDLTEGIDTFGPSLRFNPYDRRVGN